MSNIHLEQAKDAVRKGDYITATVEATAAINEDDKCAEAYIIRAQLSMAFGDRAGASDDFRRAAEIDPSILDGLNGEFRNKEENPVYKVNIRKPK